MDDIDRLMALFAGHSGVSGTHGEPDLNRDGLKWTIRRTAMTLREPPTRRLWELHLNGERPLGVVCIREDSRVRWGSIDVDVYDDDHLSLVSRVRQAEMPLVPCWSKSGGIHLFMFVTDWVGAEEVQSSLRHLAARLGLGGSEIFPRQTQVLSERGDLGNWMVMPYFGGTFGGRLHEQAGVKRTGASMTLREFLDAAEAARVTPEQVVQMTRPAARGRARTNGAATGEFSDGPPCLQHLAAVGVEEGGRNNALFMMGIYYKRAHPAEWKQKLEEANRLYLRPPGESDAVQQVIRSLEKRDYEYTCKTEPMASHCDSRACRLRRFGVGDSSAFPDITAITKLDSNPPVWFVSVEGARLRCETDQLLQFVQFQKLCMEQLNRVYQPMSQKDWSALLHPQVVQATVQPAPPDISTAEQFREQLEEFLTNRARGQRQEDLLLGRPWEDEATGAHFFRLQDLQRFLVREGQRDLKRSLITQMIEDLGGGSKFMNIRGKGVNTWFVPSDRVSQAPDPTPPEVKESPI